MTSVGVKLRPETYHRVKRLAEEQRTSMQEIVARGIEALERQEFAAGFQQDFAALRRDPLASAQDLAEREDWEQILSDELDQ